MNRQDVIRENLVDRYLMGQMNEAEIHEFEVFYLSCPETIDDLETTDKLLQGFRASAFAQRSTHGSKKPTAVPAGGRVNWPALAASLVAGVALTFAFQSQRELSSQRSSLSQADINTPILNLGVTRGVGAPRIIEIPRHDTRVAVAFDIGYPDANVYRMGIRNERDEIVWSTDNLVPDNQDSLTFSLPPGLLKPGAYRLTAEPLREGGVPLVIDTRVQYSD